MIEITQGVIGYFAEKIADSAANFVHLFYRTNELEPIVRSECQFISTFFRKCTAPQGIFYKNCPFVSVWIRQNAHGRCAEVVLRLQASIFRGAKDDGFSQNCENCLKNNS